MLEKRRLHLGMNGDDDQRDVVNGETRFNLNCRVGTSDGDSYGSIENTKGNVLVQYALPTGVNKCVGAIENKEKRYTIYFIFNSLNFHQIVQFLHDSTTIQLVYQSATLNFSQSRPITGINIIEDLLYWSDARDFQGTLLGNPPRKINIETAKNSQYNNTGDQEIFDAIKYPPLSPPLVDYADDSTRDVNYLEDKSFQFKARFIYDDDEKSAYGPISQVPIPAFDCDEDFTSFTNNRIDITVPTGSGIADKIEIVARTSNIGDFFSIVVLDKQKESIADNSTHVFQFFNEKNYVNINVRESNLLFDNVPQITPSQEIIDGNILTYGDIVESYDPVDVDAELEVTYTSQTNSGRFDIEGKIFIRNPFANDKEYELHQPIHDPNNDGTLVFGGFESGRSAIGESYTSDILTDYRQELVAGGFIVYLAGTEHYGISKQRSGLNPGIQDPNTGAYQSDTRTKRNLIRDEIEGSSGGASGETPDTRMFSTFTIKDVPAGKYVLRVAGHETTISQLNDGTLTYQSTSTYTLDVGGSNKHELEVEVIDQNIDIDPVEIMDLTDSRVVGISLNASSACSGNVVDKDVPGATTITQLLGDTRIELASVSFDGDKDRYNTLIDGSILSTWVGGKTYTDHNGFYYFTTGADTIPDQAFSISNDLQMDIFDQSINSPLTPTTTKSSNEHLEYLLRNTRDAVQDNSRTKINGTVQNSVGRGVKNVNVVVARGDIQATDKSGVYETFVYGNTIVFDASTSEGRLNNILYVLPSAGCAGTFSPSNEKIDITIGSGASPTTGSTVSPYIGLYNEANIVTINNVTVSILGINGVQKFHKRGGEWQYGIVYGDRGNRSGAVNTDFDDLKLFIPFYTQEDPDTGLIPDTGFPTVDWTIKHLPPEFATTYQWYRTKNSTINRYVQWAADDIVYLTDADVSSNFNDAVKLSIDIDPMFAEFKVTHPDSLVTYDFAVGDRIRFIKDNNGNFFTGYFDYKILSFTANVLQIEKDINLGQIFPGTVFEIYTPKLDVDEEIYFEVGEHFTISNSGQPSRAHNGSTQNQDPDNPSTTPAKGIFTNGDAYYRTRIIPVPAITGNVTTAIDDASISDFYSSQIEDIGRPNVVDDNIKQIRRPSVIYHSGNFEPDTQINGLNRFFTDTFEEYDRKYGPIKKLYAENKRLEVYQELKIGWIPVSENLIVDNQNLGVLGTSAQVLNRIQYYYGEWGIGRNPESFAVWGSTKYCYDVNRGVVLRLGGDGLTPISEFKQHNFFTDISKQLLETVVDFNVYGVYDKDFDEYVLAIGAVNPTQIFERLDGSSEPPGAELEIAVEMTPTGTATGEYEFETEIIKNERGLAVTITPERDTVTGKYIFRESYQNTTDILPQPTVIQGFTIAFSEKINKWVTYYDYKPDFMSSYGTGIITWSVGRLFIHNLNPIFNNFYGVQFESEIHVPSNERPSKNKIYQVLEQEVGDAANDIWEAFSIETLKGQESELIAEDFDELDGIFWAAMLNDKNTPNVTNPLIEGDILTDTSLIAKLRTDNTTLTKIYSVGFKYVNSELTDR